MATVELLGAEIIAKDLADQPAKVQKAYLRAAKRAIDSGRSLLVKLIAADTGLKQKDVRDQIAMQYEIAGAPSTAMRARTKRLPLIDFKARQTKSGVTYLNPGGGRSKIESAFLATTRVQTQTSGEFAHLAGSGGDHEGVFRRVDKKRLPIKQLYGPSIGKVFSKFRQQGVDKALEVFEKNFDHELAFANSQAGGADGGAD